MFEIIYGEESPLDAVDINDIADLNDIRWYIPKILNDDRRWCSTELRLHFGWTPPR
ncbi:MAG: hypothetical protein AB7T49_19200 [Oligoflexales bacterium]